MSFHCRLLDVLSLVFDTVGVAVFIVYHFVLFCRPGTQNNCLFLNAKPIRIRPKIVSVCPTDLDVRKLSDSNLNSITSSGCPVTFLTKK